jgi:pSer/pThr/pTyr-binding forkhead associated (FHA) protein
MAPTAWLAVRSGPDAGRRYPLTGEQVILGRSSQCEIVLADLQEQASRQHAQVHWQDGAWTVKDLGSMNGTFLNERRLSPHVPYTLYPGDRIRVAGTMLVFEADREEAGRTPSMAVSSDGLPRFSSELGPRYRHRPLVRGMALVAALLVLALVVLALLILTGMLE